MPPVRDPPDVEHKTKVSEPQPKYYATSFAQIKGLIRLLMSCKLKELTGNADANMKWGPVHYALGVVYRGGYRLVGWPKEDGVPFGNLSDVPGGLPVMEKLLSLWLEGAMFFAPAEDDYRDLAKRNPKAVLPADPPPRKPGPRRWAPYGRDDIGKGRARPKTNPEGKPLRRKKDGPRTPKLLLDSDIEESDEVDSDVED